MPKNGQSEVDLTGEGGLPADVAKTVSGVQGSGPEDEHLLEEDVELESADDADEEAAPAQEADQDTEAAEEEVTTPKVVDYKKFARVYADGAEAKKALASERREREALRLENEALKRGNVGQPNTQQPKGKLTVQDAINQAAEAAAAKANAPLLLAQEVNNAKEMLEDFWSSASEEEKAYRGKVDKAVISGVKSQAYTLEELNPEIILATLIGQDTMTSRRAAHAASSAGAKKVAASNKNARAENGHRAAPGPKASDKKFSEKSLAEIEAEFGSVKIYRRGERPEDSDDE